MSYQINKSDGTLLVDLIDGIVDTNSTDLALIGRNYVGFGEQFNENFVKLLENFAAGFAPSNPVRGQIWYDTNTGRINVYNGTDFETAGAPIVTSDTPTMTEGDLHINPFTKQLFFATSPSSGPILAGPIYTEQQGESGFKIRTIQDIQERDRVVADFYLAGQLVAIISNIEFTPNTAASIPFEGNVKKGFNFIDETGFVYQGTAKLAQNVINQAGEIISADQFVPADRAGTMSGTLFINNNNGLTVGTGSNHILKVAGTTVAAENRLKNQDYTIRVNAEGIIKDAVFVDADQERVGIFTTTPAHTLDINGDARIVGNLLVEGTTTSVDSTVLRVADKNIELGITDDSTMLTEAQADGAGILVKVQGDDKTITWDFANDAWNISTDLNIPNNKGYYINNTLMLDQTTLYNITSAPAVTSIGTLSSLTVGTLSINGTSSITNSSGDINITPIGDLNLNNKKIRGVTITSGDGDTYVTNKGYVDTAVNSLPVAFSMDITGLNDTQIALVLNDIFPAADKEIGTTARVHTTSYTSVPVTGIEVTVSQFPDQTGTVVYETRAVDSNGTNNVTVVEDIAQGVDATGTINLSPTRGLKHLVVVDSGGTNIWQVTTGPASSV